MDKCKVCQGALFGYGGSIKMPLCRYHYIKLIQLKGYYYDREGCPHEGSEDEWTAVKEIIEGGENSENICNPI